MPISNGTSWSGDVGRSGHINRCGALRYLSISPSDLRVATHSLKKLRNFDTSRIKFAIDDPFNTLHHVYMSIPIGDIREGSIVRDELVECKGDTSNIISTFVAAVVLAFGLEPVLRVDHGKIQVACV